ncbi:DUF1493 family protein [Chitinophaga sp. SYP-B3965]|uniref:DUF1493 family protein n=1 Tax=Chitinophaga sp. SYP-B3965 TaxID=2663120 RepID=UPI001299FE1D|nr:DUF1493 family protein [Chitinophaga sp. SYP-B3965]MRG44191.1 DUF1493 family protein [Chitinophaga sp. SYP-B3965]
MDNEVFERIVLLVESKMGKYKWPMSRETCLEKDLGMSGDDAYEFLLDFSKEFKISLSEFEMKKYFYPEGDSIFPGIIRLFTGRDNPKQMELTLGHLEKAVIAGRLDEDVISF